MKKLFSLVIVLALFSSLFASESISKHSVSINAGGPLSLFGYEYQYSFITKSNFKSSLSLGVYSAIITLNFPVGIEVAAGNKNQIIAGAYYVPNALLYDPFDDMEEEVVWGHSFSPRIGYKRLIDGKHNTFFAQIFYSPVIFLDNGNFYSWGGLGVGAYF